MGENDEQFKLLLALELQTLRLEIEASKKLQLAELEAARTLQLARDTAQDELLTKHLVKTGTAAGGIATFLAIVQLLLEKYLG